MGTKTITQNPPRVTVQDTDFFPLSDGSVTYHCTRSAILLGVNKITATDSVGTFVEAATGSIVNARVALPVAYNPTAVGLNVSLASSKLMGAGWSGTSGVGPVTGSPAYLNGGGGRRVGSSGAGGTAYVMGGNLSAEGGATGGTAGDAHLLGGSVAAGSAGNGGAVSIAGGAADLGVGGTVTITGGSGATPGIVALGATRFAQLADAAAANDTVYFSTTQSKLVYKTAGGTVLPLTS